MSPNTSGGSLSRAACQPGFVSDVTESHGSRMSEREVARFLRSQGVGVLALASDGAAYAVPLSFGYADDPRRLYFEFVRFGDESRKIAAAEDTAEACFVTLDATSRFDWRSAVATGPLRTVPEDEREAMDAAMDDNGWFPSLFPPDEPMTGVRRLAMEPASVTGRKREVSPV